MAKWEPSATEFYVEQAGVVADALQECLVQDYGGVIRIAPAIPPGWDFDGSVYVGGKTRVDVQTRNGRVRAVVIEAGIQHRLMIRNPWPGEPVEVDSTDTAKTVTSTTSPTLEFEADAGHVYILQRQAQQGSRLEPISGTQPISPKRFGRVQIGLFRDHR